MSSSGPRPTKSERLEAARVEARAKREAAEKKRRSRSLWTKIIVIVGVVAVAAGASLWYYFGVVKANNTFADQGPIPAAGNEWGGVTLDSPTTMVKGAGGQVDVNTVKDASSEAGAKAAPQGVKKDAKPAQIIVYADVLCPHCAQFENENASVLDKFLADKSATVEYRLASIIPSATNYPARGANALYCVAEKNPAAFLPTMKALYADQKERSNAELAKVAEENGAPDLSSCITNGTYRPFAAISQGKMYEANVGGTPAVFINGVEWPGTANFATWAEEQVKAANK